MNERIWVPPGGSADPHREREAEPAPPPGDAITPEELAEQIRRLKVSDVLLSTLATIAQLGYAKLDPASRDLEQARLAIEAFRALVPVLEGSVDSQTHRDFAQLLSNLQLAYASAADEATASTD